MPRTIDPTLDEAGLDEDVVAGSIARVFGLMLDSKEPAGEPVGWLAVVRATADLLGGEDESDVQVPLHKFADTIRSAYGYALDPDYNPCPPEELPPAVRLGWQAVTRHLINVFSMDSKEARLLESHEARMAEYVKASATPK